MADPKGLPEPAEWKSGVLLRGEDGGRFLAPNPEPETIIVCTEDNWNDNCDFKSIQQAAQFARDGDIILLKPGRYAQAAVIHRDRITIRAEVGALMTGVATQGKAALVVKGNEALIEGLECSEISVSDRNGACVRLEGSGLTLRNVYFHDSEQGVLGGGGRIVVEDSLFERLGAGGRAHGLYVWGSEVILRRSKVLSSKGEGHGLKSRAARTVVEYSILASLDGNDSRLIDVSNGGEVEIRQNVLQIGRQSSNRELVGVGYEGLRYPENAVLMEGNTIILDRPGAQIYGGPVPAVIRDNLVIGGQAIENNLWRKDRSAAGLQPYPALAPIPGEQGQTK